MNHMEDVAYRCKTCQISDLGGCCGCGDEL